MSHTQTIDQTLEPFPSCNVETNDRQRHRAEISRQIWHPEQLDALQKCFRMLILGVMALLGCLSTFPLYAEPDFERVPLTLCSRLAAPLAEFHWFCCLLPKNELQLLARTRAGISFRSKADSNERK